MLRGEPMDARLHVEWLQGAIARNLKYDIQGTFIATPTTFEGYKGFYFDDPSRVFNTEESKPISGVTNERAMPRYKPASSWVLPLPECCWQNLSDPGSMRNPEISVSTRPDALLALSPVCRYQNLRRKIRNN